MFCADSIGQLVKQFCFNHFVIFLLDMTVFFAIFDLDSHLLKKTYPMTMFYIAFFPPKNAISLTIFPNSDIYFRYNYNIIYHGVSSAEL